MKDVPLASVDVALTMTSSERDPRPLFDFEPKADAGSPHFFAAFFALEVTFFLPEAIASKVPRLMYCIMHICWARVGSKFFGSSPPCRSLPSATQYSRTSPSGVTTESGTPHARSLAVAVNPRRVISPSVGVPSM